MEDRLIENKAYRVILLGVLEIVGQNGLKSILNYAGLAKHIDMVPAAGNGKMGPKISEVSKLSESIEEIYGTNGARAILTQVGRMQARLGIQENADVANAARDAMAGMSEGDRAKVILAYTADTISQQLNTKTWVEQVGNVIYYRDESATHCFGRKSGGAVCHTATGFVAGMVDWAVGNNGWKVEETECMAMGYPHCTYRVYRETAA